MLVDDGSRDGTGDIARALPSDGQLGVLDGAERPAGWAGKLWAVQQGVAATFHDWLLLSDADIEHDPAHVSTLVAHAERTGADMVSEMVALHCESLAERALVPAFVYFFQLLYPFAWVNDPKRRTAAAAGGTVLIRRAALERAGGLAAIAGALIDDVALAKAVKRGGGTIWLGHSRLARSIRPYPQCARHLARWLPARPMCSFAARRRCWSAWCLGWHCCSWRRPAAALFGHGPANWIGLARLGGDGLHLRADPGALRPLAALGAAAAADRGVLHGRHHRLGDRPPSRPRRGLEAARLYGRPKA